VQLVFLGPPGSGKGTQAKFIAEHFQVPHISTGDIFRRHLSEGTPLGQLARQYMDQGALVPDDVTESMVADRIDQPDAAGGFVLDGFPRNRVQAEDFDGMLRERHRRLTRVLYFQVPEAVLIQRLTGRRVCRQCGATYHVIFQPPRIPGVCDVCGGELIQRRDDQEDTVVKRLDVYRDETAPLVEYYEERGLLAPINADQSVEAVTEAILAAIGGQVGG